MLHFFHRRRNYEPLNTTRVISVERADGHFLSSTRSGVKIKSKILEIEEAYNTVSGGMLT